jgi:hypothetical protein
MFANLLSEGSNHEVATGPYLCLDISLDKKLLMSQWFQRKGNEKSKDRKTLFVHGPRIDQRTLPSTTVGDALAALHCANTCLNIMFRRWTGIKMHASFQDYGLNALCDGSKQKPRDRTTTLAATFGPDLCAKIMKNLKKDYDRSTEEYPIISGTSPKDCPRPIYSSLIGRDLGMPFTYPIACAMAYAVQGRSSAVEEITKSLERFWDAYSEALERAGTHEEFVHKAYRNGLGWGGWFLYLSYYKMKAYTHVLPLNDVKVEDQNIVLDSIGVVGTKMMRWAFGGYEENLSFKQLRQRVDETLQDEVDMLLDINLVNLIHVNKSEPLLEKPKRTSNEKNTLLDVWSLGFWWL